MTRDIYQVMKEMGHSKITTTQIYADFQISRLEIDFPSIAYAPNQPIFGKMDTNMMDTNKVYSSWKLSSVKPEVASSSLVGPALKSNTKHSSIKASLNCGAFCFHSLSYLSIVYQIKDTKLKDTLQT